MTDLTHGQVLAPLRRQRQVKLPPLGASLAILFLFALLLAALAPGLFTRIDPLAIVPREAFQPPAGRTGWAPTSQAATSSRGSSTAPARAC